MQRTKQKTHIQVLRVEINIGFFAKSLPGTGVRQCAPFKSHCDINTSKPRTLNNCNQTSIIAVLSPNVFTTPVKSWHQILVNMGDSHIQYTMTLKTKNPACVHLPSCVQR